MQHVTVNLIYKPTKAIETGIEYNHVRRTTITGQNGVGKRFQSLLHLSFLNLFKPILNERRFLFFRNLLFLIANLL